MFAAGRPEAGRPDVGRPDGRGTLSMTRTSRSRGTALLSAVGLMVALTVGTFQITQARADSPWNPAAVLKVLKAGTGQVVIAHRGIYGPKCPENSRCSIEWTYSAAIEGIELDIKQSKNGTPWLFHEKNIGRLIAHDPAFDPFQDATSPKGWNPDLRTLADNDIQDLFLRDETGAKTGYHPVSLLEAFNLIKSQGLNHMVIVLDIKTLDAVSRAADLAKRTGLQDAVVLKFSSSLLADNSGAYFDLDQTTKGVPFVVTMYASDMANIMRAGWEYADCKGRSALETSQCTIESWIMDLQDRPGYAWLEVGNKMPVPDDPTDFLLESKNLGARGGFQPVPEYPDRTGPGHSFVRTNGTCCASLDDYLTPANQWFPAETKDGRQDIHNLLDHGITSVITDDPRGAIQAATKRNTGAYH